MCCITLNLEQLIYKASNLQYVFMALESLPCVYKILQVMYVFFLLFYLLIATSMLFLKISVKDGVDKVMREVNSSLKYKMSCKC